MNNKRPNRNSGQRHGKGAEKEFDQQIIDIARVTRVMAGGKRMRFRCCIVIGDKKGRVGSAVAKGADVPLAINKAVAKAKKNLITVPIINETIPHRVDIKFGAAKILLKPAPKGTGIIAGGAVRTILSFAGISNVVGKILGTNNKLNNVRATIKALSMLKKVEIKQKTDSRDQKSDNGDQKTDSRNQKSEMSDQKTDKKSEVKKEEVKEVKQKEEAKTTLKNLKS